METGKGILFPNIYCMLVAHPGVGKTATIRKGRQYYMSTPEPHPAPTSLTGASMIDAMVKNKKVQKMNGGDPLEYNTMFITADELGAFMHKYDSEVIAVMSAFYDNDGFSQWRRGNDLKLHIKSPQMNALCGSTPSNLVNIMPEFAWEQGFTSRFIMVFSDERILGNDFADAGMSLHPDLVHDIRSIATLTGQFHIDRSFVDSVQAWREAGEPPTPTHPKLLHYATRRRVHVYKLSMVSAIDRSDKLSLIREDFERALGWLTEAERHMGEIFKAGASNSDDKAMDEIYHFVLMGCAGGRTMPSNVIMNFAKKRVPLNSLRNLMETMEKSGMLKSAGLDPKNKGVKLYTAGLPIDPLADDLGRVV